MANDRPVASVSGKQEWAWNRWQAERRREPTHRAGRSREGRRPPDGPAQRPRLSTPPYEDRALERTLHETEQRLQLVIRQYERILDEKNREIAERAEVDRPGQSLLTAFSDAVRRLVFG